MLTNAVIALSTGCVSFYPFMHIGADDSVASTEKPVLRAYMYLAWLRWAVVKESLSNSVKLGQQYKHS